MNVQNLNRKQLISSWIALHESEEDSVDYEKNFWAFEKLDGLIHHSPDVAWQIILDILHANISDRVFGNLAAGPLEDLLGEHEAMFIDRVELEVKKNKEFKRLLGGVWQGAMSNEIWARVQVVAGERW